MRKVTVSRMREGYAQTVLTFRITYVYVNVHQVLYSLVEDDSKCQLGKNHTRQCAVNAFGYTKWGEPQTGQQKFGILPSNSIVSLNELNGKNATFMANLCKVRQTGDCPRKLTRDKFPPPQIPCNMNQKFIPDFRVSITIMATTHICRSHPELEFTICK